MPARLLVLSNGHGEDLIALRVLQALLRRHPELEIAVLPLVGEGHAYAALEQAGIPVLVLTRCNWRANDGVDAKIAAFLKGAA